MMKRAALYVRVSTQEQKTHGISARKRYKHRLEEQLKNAAADTGTRRTSGASPDKKKDALQKKLR